MPGLFSALSRVIEDYRLRFSGPLALLSLFLQQCQRVFYVTVRIVHYLLAGVMFFDD